MTTLIIRLRSLLELGYLNDLGFTEHHHEAIKNSMMWIEPSFYIKHKYRNCFLPTHLNYVTMLKRQRRFKAILLTLSFFFV